MKYLLSQLRALSKKYFLQEKILIVPSHALGQQLVQILAREDCPVVNLKVETLSGLAEKLCQPYLCRNQLSLVPAALAIHLLQGVLKELSAGGQLRYFDQLEITPGIAAAVYNALSDLKLAGVDSMDLTGEKFVDVKKGTDLKNIYKNYKQVLKDRKLVDAADLYRLVLDNTPQLDEMIYLIPANLRLQPLERSFLEAVTKNNRKVIYFTPVRGLGRPRAYFFSTLKETEEEISVQNRRAWLYDLANAPGPAGDCGMEMFQAYGENSEVREIIRKLKREKIAFDQAAVYYPVQEPYSQLFFNLAQQLNLPVTFGQGIAISNTRPGRLFYGWLDWIRSNYAAAQLHALFTSGDFAAGDDKNLPGLVRLLRSAGIGWGRDRYLPRLEKKILDCQDVLQEAGGEDSKVYYEKQLKNLTRLRDLLSRILALIPEPDAQGRIDYSALIKGLVKLMDDFSRIQNQMDEEAKRVIIGELEIITACATESLPLEEVLNRLEDLGSGLRVNCSPPRPGALHVDHYQRGTWFGRPYTFIPGLHAGQFPGQRREDAVLLDLERERLDLYLKKDQVRENLFEMVQVLVSAPGRVVLSYPVFDPVENKELFPAALLLQVFRLMEGDETKDYSHLLASFPEQKGLVPVEVIDVLDEGEWWLNRNFSQKIKNLPETVRNCYKNLGRGWLAWQERKSERFTEFDGKVPVKKEVLDPRCNHRFVVSSGQLETLGTCPYCYFLSFILGVRPPDDPGYDPGVWLDPVTRGSLLHSLYERFYRELAVTGEKPELAKHEDFLYELAGELIARQETEFPPPNEVVYAKEKQEIMNSCRVFLASEEEYCRQVTPRFFELSFGVKFEKNNDQGKLPPVAIELPAGDKFYLKGKIDRVDETGDVTYQVLDYKTGSTYNHQANEYVKGGRQLQHALYAVALEEILRQKNLGPHPQVTASGYVFPTLKGEGQRVMRSQKDRSVLYEVLNNFFELLAQGNFVMTDDPGDCRFCDYWVVCEPGLTGEAVKQKIESDPGLEPLRRWRSFD